MGSEISRLIELGVIKLFARGCCCLVMCLASSPLNRVKQGIPVYDWISYILFPIIFSSFVSVSILSRDKSVSRKGLDW
jgi:hypothetical protein